MAKKRNLGNQGMFDKAFEQLKNDVISNYPKMTWEAGENDPELKEMHFVEDVLEIVFSLNYDPDDDALYYGVGIYNDGNDVLDSGACNNFQECQDSITDYLASLNHISNLLS